MCLTVLLLDLWSEEPTEAPTGYQHLIWGFLEFLLKLIHAPGAHALPAQDGALQKKLEIDIDGNYWE